MPFRRRSERSPQSPARTAAAGSRTRAGFVAVLVAAAATIGALYALPASGNPDHSAGDYFIFAKAASGNTGEIKGHEPDCNSSNDKQADVSGSNHHIYGRVHSNADLAVSGSGNVFHDVATSPNPELTFGVNDGAGDPCQLQAVAGLPGGNDFTGAGYPVNITGSGDGDTTDGPYQIDETAPLTGWPGNLGNFLTGPDYREFGNNVADVLPGASCGAVVEPTAVNSSLTHTSSDIVVRPTANNNNKVICVGEAKKIIISETPAGGAPGSTALNPFKITMIGHGPIEVSASSIHLAPADSGHGVLAWTDEPTEDNAFKISGSNVNILTRSIAFTPSSGQSVSGSNQATMCLQLIGQGSIIAAGSNTNFGPFAPGCAQPPAQPKLELRKEIAPTDDNGTFDLFAKQGGVEKLKADDVGHNGTSGAGGTSVAPGTYDLSEEGAGGTDLNDYTSSLACKNRSDNSAVTVTNGSVTLANGADVICTFTNTRDATIQFVKDVVSATDPTKTFVFTGPAWVNSSPYGDNQGETETISSFPASDQTVSETREAGWAESVSCTGDTSGDTSVDNANATTVSATFRPDPGENIVCTFLNQDDASIQFVKDVESATEPTKTFVFTGGAWVDSSPYGDGQGETQTISDWPAGEAAQTVSETRETGWSESVSCTGDNSGDTSVNNADPTVVSATFRPDPGENIVCTFLNQDDATIQFVKDVESATDPTKTFVFTGGAWVDSSPYGDGQGETQTISSFPASDQTVSETRIAGWSESVSCTGDTSGDTSVDNADTSTVSATFRPDPGENIVCTFLNQDDASIQFVKDVESATEPTKTFVFTGGAWVDSSPYGDGQGETQTVSSFPASDQTVSETREAGWSESVSCTGDDGDTSVDNADATTVSATFRPDPGENIVCTFLNQDDASIQFVKEVESETNPTKTFVFTGPAWVNSSPYGDSQGETETISSFPASDQTVSETREAGWSESVSCTGDNSDDTTVDNADTSTVSATFRPDPGEHIVCTFTNTHSATIQFVKDVVSATSPNQTFAFTGPAWVNSSPYGDGQGETETISSFPASDQTVSETRIAGWSESVSCTGDTSADTTVDNANATTVSATFRPDPGENIVCTFVNREDATIQFIKDVVSATEPNKTFAFTGPAWVNSSPYGEGQGETETISDWPAGEADQTVSETRVAGWSESVSCTGDTSADTTVDNADASTVSATFRPDPGEDIVCTFLNQDDATISFVKDVVSTTEPTKTFVFTGPAWVNSSPYGDNQGETETIAAWPAGEAAQTVSETRIAGWSESVSCTGDNSGDTTVDNGNATTVSATFRPDPGENISCTFLNTQDPVVSAPARTPGFWKNHPAVTGPLLPVYLGNYSVSSLSRVQSVFKAMNCGSSKPQAAIGCLAGHLLAAKLNVKSGASTCINATITKADNFLKGQTVDGVSGVTYTGPTGSYSLTAAQRALAITLKNALDKYNNGGGC